MTTFVALLRGINVGGNNRLPMAELRVALAADGLTGARTYIQSGNVVVDAATPDAEVLAAHVRAVIARSFHLDIPVVALTATDLEEAFNRNPFADEPDPRRVHAIFLPAAPSAAVKAAVSDRVAKVAEKGSRDTVALIGRVAYLHTPGGFGASDLAKALSSGRSNPLGDGTARNWATVTTLLGMCGHTGD
jgi:uncharacterized protein (DUF1697 family)